MKTSFNLNYDYRDKLKSLSDEDFGRFHRALYNYEIDGTLPEFDGVLAMAFEFIKQDLDEKKAKYEAKCEKNKANGSKGGRHKTQKSERFISKPKKPHTYSRTSAMM